MSKRPWSFNVKCTCQSCGVRMQYTRTDDNVGQEPRCAKCGHQQESKVVEPNAMMFRRCGWGDKPSTWEEISWRPR